MAAQEKRKEFCEILGVEEQASKEEIKKAYKQLALRCHPDKNQLNPEATQEFQKISRAYTGLCEGDTDSADEDINDFDGGVSLFELLQLFFSISKKSFFMRSPSSWFNRYSEDSDEVNDSDDVCDPTRQNLWNHAGQPSWNGDDHFMSGNARPSSSSTGAGKTGKAKKRKNRKEGGGGGRTASSQNNNRSSVHQGMAGAGTNASTGANSSASTRAGVAGDRTSASNQHGLATDATNENQLPGRAGVSDLDANQGSVNNRKSGRIPESSSDDCTRNAGGNLERRGSDGSVRGTAPNSQGQAAEKKPNKKKLQAEQRKREKECAAIHREVLEKNQREEEKRRKKAEKERAKLDTEFMQKLNATSREETKTIVNEQTPEVNSSNDKQDDCHGASAEMNDAKEEEMSDTASLDSESGFVKRIENGVSLESSETLDSMGVEVMSDSGQQSSNALQQNDNVQRSDNRKGSVASFDGDHFDENRPELGCNGDGVCPNQNERQKFTRVFYGHSSKNQIKNPRVGHNFDNSDGGNNFRGHFQPVRGFGYRDRTDNSNYRPRSNNNGFVDRSLNRGFKNSSEQNGPLNNDDRSCHINEEANSNAGFMDTKGQGNRGRYGRGRYHGNGQHYQNYRSGFRNPSELPSDQSKSTNRIGLGRDVDSGSEVVGLDVKTSGDGASLDTTQCNLPNLEFQSRIGTDKSVGQEGLPYNGNEEDCGVNNPETSKKGFWPRSNRNYKSQRGNFGGGFDGGGGRGRTGGDHNFQPSRSFRSSHVQESWGCVGSSSGSSGNHVNQHDCSAAEMPAAEPGKEQDCGKRPDQGQFRRGGGRGSAGGGGGRGRVFNLSDSQECWDSEDSRSVNHVDQVDNNAKEEVPVLEAGSAPYRGGRPYRGPFRSGRGGRGKGFGQARERTGETYQPRSNRTAEWEPGKKRFGTNTLERDSTSAYGREEYDGTTMQFHRRKQMPGEAVPVPSSAANSSAKNQSRSDLASLSDGTRWTSRPAEGRPTTVPESRNVWKDRREFYEGALPRSKEEEDEMLKAALELSGLEIEEQQLSEQVQTANPSLSFTTSSFVARPSETGWTADVLDSVVVDPDPPQHKRTENASTDDSPERPQPRSGRAEDDRSKSGGTSPDKVERVTLPTAMPKSWADEMEETNDGSANVDASPNDSLVEPNEEPVQSPCLGGKTTHSPWALMNFGTSSDAVDAASGSEEAKFFTSNPSANKINEIKAVASTVRESTVHPPVPDMSSFSVTQPGGAVFDRALRPTKGTFGVLGQSGAKESVSRQTSMLDDVDEEEPSRNQPPDSVQGAAASDFTGSRGFPLPPFPPVPKHLPEPGNMTASGVCTDRIQGEAPVDFPESHGLCCPAFPPGPMPPPPWMQPGCPTYFFAVPGYPPWYPMPPYQHYWPCLPSGAPGMPGVMPMVSQSLSLAHSSSPADQPTVSQVLPTPLSNSLPLHGPAAIPGLPPPPSMPAMLHPIPFGYPPHPAHLVPSGAAMHVPFSPYSMPPPPETVDPTDPPQETDSATNRTDESRRCA